jgi:hypothetical protein
MKLTKAQKIMLEVIKTEVASGLDNGDNKEVEVEMDPSERKVCENLANKGLIIISEPGYGGYFSASLSPAILPDKHGWFKISGVGLPENKGRYLLYFPTESSSPMDGMFDGKDFIVDGIRRTSAVTHWQPLTPPEGD